ncbi:hypothetical protein MNBD_PLANCTO02-646 [hydrothermal vent metagenome]|uniref:Uncharacterized protein n=1 Tax=hydrothermal vent metagenome TaxID=652676 RepID=A0A3B1DA25_9ZZZZ
MSQTELTDNQLLFYFDEMLAVDEMRFVEQALRDSQELQKRLALLAQSRDRGVHSVGEIWRNDRLSCPARSQLGNYLLGTLDQTNSDYIQFHAETIGCRICTANLEDMQKAADSTPETKQRRQRFFQTSAGHLRKFSH